MMRKIEFKELERPVEEDMKEFVQIAKFLTTTQSWTLTNKFESEYEAVCWFQKSGVEIKLYYDTMDGMYLGTCDEAFDLESLFNEINTHLKNETGVDNLRQIP